VEYYNNVSSSIDKNEEFTALLNNSWNVKLRSNGGQAQGASLNQVAAAGSAVGGA